MLDYEILRIIWWLLLGVLLIGFAIMDGFDLGVAALLPFIAKTDKERRVVINTVAPVWEGNQVWLLLGGGAIFAAWPFVYAISFSGFYLAIMLVLFSLILRPVAFKFRSKMENETWRETWDWCLFVGGAVPALIFGVAVGNVIQGVPFHMDELFLTPLYTGGFFGLLNPFAILCGLVSVAMLVMHGGVYIALKTEMPLSARASEIARHCALAALGLFVLAGVWVAVGIDGYAFTSEINTTGPSNPVAKVVVLESGQWMQNMMNSPWKFLAPLLAIGGLLGTFLFIKQESFGYAFITSGTALLGIISTVGLAMFPFILPSSSHPSHSLTVWDASSSEATLFNMLIAALIFVPIVLLYTAWVFHVLRGKVTPETIENTTGEAY